MKWEADWWGVTLIAESPSGETTEDMELLLNLSKKLSVKTDKYYEHGEITIEDDFNIDKVRVFKIIFHR